MPFLLKSDYGAQIKQDLLNTVLDSDDAIRTGAELSAQAEIEGYLRGRYDVAQIFIEVLPWAESTQYAAGAAVAQAGLIYVATRATKAEQPGAAAEEPAEGEEPAAPAWEAKDPRHPLIKTYLIDCTLYLIHSRQNPRSVPQIRQDRYDHAISYLNMCRQGKLSPGLPLLTDTAADGTTNTQSIRPRGGSSHKKLNNSY
jgi:phage gp36-like protein